MSAGQHVQKYRDLVVKEEAQNAYLWSRRVINYCSFAFLACFSAIQLNAVSIMEMATQTDPDVLVRIGILIYYNAWFFGAKLDTGMNEQIFLVDPDRGRFPWSFAFILPGFIAVAGTLLFVADNVSHLSLVLAIFWFVDFLMWWNYVRFMKRRGGPTAHFCIERRMYPELEQLRFMLKHYIALDWQLQRFSCMGLLLLAFLVAAHSEQARSLVQSLWGLVVSEPAAAKLANGTPHALFLSYVVMAEAWSWWMRLKTKRFIQAVEDVKRSYVLLPIAESKSVAVMHVSG